MNWKLLQVCVLCSFLCVKKIRQTCKLIKSITVVIVKTHSHSYSQSLYLTSSWPFTPFSSSPITWIMIRVSGKVGVSTGTNVYAYFLLTFMVCPLVCLCAVVASAEDSTRPTASSLSPWQPSPKRRLTKLNQRATRWVQKHIVLLKTRNGYCSNDQINKWIVQYKTVVWLLCCFREIQGSLYTVIIFQEPH